VPRPHLLLSRYQRPRLSKPASFDHFGGVELGGADGQWRVYRHCLTCSFHFLLCGFGQAPDLPQRKGWAKYLLSKQVPPQIKRGAEGLDQGIIPQTNILRAIGPAMRFRKCSRMAQLLPRQDRAAKPCHLLGPVNSRAGAGSLCHLREPGASGQGARGGGVKIFALGDRDFSTIASNALQSTANTSAGERAGAGDCACS
jgi:hypothetical protein